MTKQTPPMDWEAAMKATEENAEVAAKMTERAVAALAEALDHLRRHGQQLARVEASMKQALTRPTPSAPNPCPSSRDESPSYRRPLFLTSGIFLVGVAFGVFIANW